MTQEIELKFIVTQDSVATLRDKLSTLSDEYHSAQKLHNTYYETADNFLRRHDMGLRIRGKNGKYEMTMKTSGQTTGGLHQRPEYNVALENAVLNLSLFPETMWPQDTDVSALESQLSPLFSTDFERETWIVMHSGSRIEVAFDRGEICAGESHEAICELELELLAGDIHGLLELASLLMDISGIRMGSLSKAARGYHLAAGAPKRVARLPQILNLPSKLTVEQALEASIAQAFNDWLYHEEIWLRSEPDAKNALIYSVKKVRHILAVFSGVIPRKATSELRERLMAFEASLEDNAISSEILYHPEIGKLRLAIVTWLAEYQWRNVANEKSQAKLNGSFKRFADINLSRYNAELKAIFQHPLGDTYCDKLSRLAREIDAISILAGVYNNAQAVAWFDNWVGLYQAIVTHQIVEIEHYRNEAISQAPFWLHSGN